MTARDLSYVIQIWYDYKGPHKSTSMMSQSSTSSSTSGGLIGRLFLDGKGFRWTGPALVIWSNWVNSREKEGGVGCSKAIPKPVWWLLCPTSGAQHTFKRLRRSSPDCDRGMCSDWVWHKYRVLNRSIVSPVINEGAWEDEDGLDDPAVEDVGVEGSIWRGCLIDHL